MQTAQSRKQAQQNETLVLGGGAVRADNGMADFSRRFRRQCIYVERGQVRLFGVVEEAERSVADFACGSVYKAQIDSIYLLAAKIAALGIAGSNSKRAASGSIVGRFKTGAGSHDPGIADPVGGSNRHQNG